LIKIVGDITNSAVSKLVGEILKVA